MSITHLKITRPKITSQGALSAAVVASTLALSGCGATSTSTSATVTTSSAATTTIAASAMSPTAAGMPMPKAAAGPHNQADITFAEMMTAHHQGAIEMADLAPSRAASTSVKELAARIKAAQEPELTEMNGWLAVWAPDTDMNGMPNSTAASTAGSMAAMGSSTRCPA